MSNIINFYSVGDEYGCFSNFAPYPIRLGGKSWPTSEHYFQAQKFEDEGQREVVRKAKTPMLAARLGRDRKSKLRRDWESVKVSVMTDAVRAKFTQQRPPVFGFDSIGCIGCDLWLCLDEKAP